MISIELLILWWYTTHQKRWDIVFEKATYKEQAYNYLLNLILDNGLEPSKIYSERYFAELMGISRTPVREAILHLAQEGYIQIMSNRGIMLKELTQQEIHDILEMRTAIEGYCAVFASEHKDCEEWNILCKKLENYLDEEERISNSTRNADEFIQNDMEFHFAIIDFCGNQKMKEVIVNLRNQINSIGIKSFHKDTRMQDTVKEHRKIVEAIKSKNASKALEYMKSHLMSCESVLNEES